MERKEHWFSFGDACVAVTEWGCRRLVDRSGGEGTLFFLHGRYGTSEAWRPVAEALSAYYRCVAVDLPGFGRSASANERGLSLIEHAELLARLVERFSLEELPSFVVGHDIGGAIAQFCLVLVPERLAGVVLINAASVARPCDGLQTGPFGLLCLMRLRTLLSASGGLEGESRAFLQGLWSGAKSRASLIASFRALSHSWPRHYERQAWRSHLRGIRQPALLLWGGRDPLHPEEAARELLLELPEAYLQIQSECGHWPPLECPVWVAEKIREFLFRLQMRSEPRKAG